MRAARAHHFADADKGAGVEAVGIEQLAIHLV
jgi:hypothetical protein